MLRIDIQNQTPDQITYSVAGRLVAEDLGSLTALIEDAAVGGRRVAFDLADVALVSREVVEYFAQGPGRDVEIVRCADYVRAWLRCSRPHGDERPQ
ncbi:MAG: hypothetical protein ABI609_01405 [Acidobacteriota bacterium]